MSYFDGLKWLKILRPEIFNLIDSISDINLSRTSSKCYFFSIMNKYDVGFYRFF